jgi:hypothetical protein
MRKWLTLCALSLGAVACARGPNITTDQLPLRRVVIYRNGVGYFERAGETDADQVVFKMRQKTVGDFLATLAIVEKGGSSLRSASFPLEVEEDEVEPPDPRYASMLKPFPVPQPKGDPQKRLREVTLSLDGEEHELAVGYVVETPVWRPSYRLVVQPGGKSRLQAWGIVQNLSGEDWNDVELTLVAGAPIAFQSTLGDAVIPSRPIVSDSGEVIAAVPESTTSLKEVPEADEEAMPAAAMAPAPSQAPAPGEGYGYSFEDGAGSMAGFAGDAKASAPKPMKKGRAAPSLRSEGGLSAPRDLSRLASVSVQSGTTNYAVPERVSLPNDSATMVLLLNQEVIGEAVFLFSPDGGVTDSSSHPFRVARFTNGTAGMLERGPIAVFNGGTFVGQGVMEPLPKAASTTVPFALERGVAVDSEITSDQVGAVLHRIENGTVQIRREQVVLTTYRIKNGLEEELKLLLKHPRRADWRLHNPPVGTEDNVGAGNALVPTTVRAQSSTKVTVEEREEVVVGVDWLDAAAQKAIEQYLSDARSPAVSVNALRQAWDYRMAWKVAADRQSALEIQQNGLETSTRETRDAMEAIEKNTQAADLRRTLTSRLDKQTAELERVIRDLVTVRLQVQEQRMRFQDALRELVIEGPPRK